jgi:hypothetical protein
VTETVDLCEMRLWLGQFNWPDTFCSLVTSCGIRSRSKVNVE